MRDLLQSKKCARLLKALADPERLRIIQCLQAGPLNVSELARLLQGELANVSHHLRVLRLAELVQDERQGKHVVYSLHPGVFRPGTGDSHAGSLDLGCCRLEWDGR